MTCHKCGANNKDEARFCTTCGSELLIPTNEEIEEGKEKRNAEKNNSMKSLIIGVSTCALSGFFGLLMLPFSIWGIMAGIKSSDTTHGKAGLVLNIVNILMQIISTLILVPLTLYTLKDLYSTERYANKYLCTDYGEVEITDNIEFELKKDKTFTLSYEYPDGKGVIKGKYSINSFRSVGMAEEKEYDYDIKLNADTRIIDNEFIEGDYQTEYKLTIAKKYILLENKISNNKYTCKKAN